MNELVKRLENLKSQILNLKSNLNLPQKEQRILELEEKMGGPNFWKDQANAQKLSQEHAGLKNIVDLWDDLEKNIAEARGALGKQDAAYLEKKIADLESQYDKNRFMALLSKKYDDHEAIVALHAGAGGTDAQDWTEMLARMLLRYCENKNLRTEILDKHPGNEAGLKSVTFEVKGPFAYGLLKSEAGVHRLVRLSPYNPAHTRETSFALVEVLPALEQVESPQIDPKDLKIEVTTSSGHGGQSVNTTYSAVRLTHIPTGLKVSIQNERSQRQNRELALKILAAKLKTLQENKLMQEKQAVRGEFKSAEWGNQIRSYVLHPYKMVKDHRTGFETSNPDLILNGELEEFVEKYLELAVSNKQ